MMKVKTLRTLFKSTILSIPLWMAMSFNAYALSYKYCNDPAQSLSCAIALEKLRTIKNPLDPEGKNYFDDGIHYTNGKVFVFPDLHIATTDLDGDGFDEIIVKVPELVDQLTGYFCKPNLQCPHYIFQDRNIGNNKTLKNVKVMGPIFTYAVGLSTNEVIGGFRSLRSYTNPKTQDFDVYQYDRKSDDYFNITPLQ